MNANNGLNQRTKEKKEKGRSVAEKHLCYVRSELDRFGKPANHMVYRKLLTVWPLILPDLL